MRSCIALDEVDEKNDAHAALLVLAELEDEMHHLQNDIRAAHGVGAGGVSNSTLSLESQLLIRTQALQTRQGFSSTDRQGLQRVPSAFFYSSSACRAASARGAQATSFSMTVRQFQGPAAWT